MKEKFLLSDEELSSVVGGFTGEQKAGMAFKKAAQHFNDLFREFFLENETNSVVHHMYHECEMAGLQSMSKHAADSVINTLEGYYSTLVSLNAQAAATARSILDTLKTSLDL